MAAAKIEKAGISFAIKRQAGPIVVELRPHHDTIAAFKGVEVTFEMLNGMTADRARKILDVLNENLVGVVVTTASNDKSEAASV
ncbi:MAG TPA: hypothetical protein VKR59_11655 [Terriglobales bacterium]|nr:hypothetical protein [Terriglobales bacterium]